MARRITLNIITTSDAKGVRETKKALNDLASTIRKLNGEFSKLAGSNPFGDVGSGINRLTRDMEQLTRAQKELRAELKRGAADSERAARGYREASEAQAKYTQSSRETERQQRRTKKATQESTREFEMIFEELDDGAAKIRRASANFENFENTMRDVAKTAGLADDQMETFETTLRDAGKTISGLDKQRRVMKELYEDLQRGEQEVTQAMQRRQAAQQKLDDLMKTPGRTNRQVEDARRELEEAARASATAEKNFARYEQRLESMRKDLQQVADVQERLNRYQSDPEYARAFADPRIANRIHTMQDALESFETVGRRLGQTLSNSLNRIRSGLGSLDEMNSDTDSLVQSLRELLKVGEDVGKLGMERFAKAIGNPMQAIAQATRAIRQQNDEAVKLGSTANRIDDGMEAWSAAERQLAMALSQGNNALRMRNQVASTFGSARSAFQGASTQIEQQRIRLMQQQNQLTQEAVSLQTRLAAAEQRREGIDRSNIAEYERATDAINELRQAMQRNDEAIEANKQNLTENAQQATRVATEFNQLQEATGRMHAQFTNLRKAVGVDLFGAITGRIRSFNSEIMQLASALSGRLISAIQRASSALRQFVGASGGAMFAGLQRSLQSIGNGFRSFADNVVNSMERARHSMMEFYAAGYSLMMMGSQIQQFGLNINREMGRVLDTYMQYEKARNQAAIAGAEAIYQDGSRGQEGNWRSGIAGFDINSEIVDRIIFGLQRGTYTPPWLTSDEGGRLPVAFDAAELAKGLYYYSSAIGVPITPENEREVAGVVATIMQAAKVTDTSVETAVKGTMNVAMEFGFDPRDLSPENAEAISKITAQMAYLANISTMEMSDIAETFKMVGPQAHFLSPGGLEGEAGAGLNETFLLAFLASEVGLRGGNVGRGINQAFTSLLDPTDKMVEVAQKYWPQITTKEQFNDFFKEDGHLKGGILGFLGQLTSISKEDRATMLAELFTSNATRSLMGPTLREFDLERFLVEIQENPFKWLETAAAETADSVNGWFQFMKNGWFQFTRGVVDSVDGPLKGAFRGVGEVFFELAEQIQGYPKLGQFIAGFTAALSGLSVVLGTVMIAAGGILVLGRSFALLGGFVGPAIRMIAFAGITLLGLIPALLAVGVAIALVRALWERNFLGMRTAFDNFRENFDLETFVEDKVTSTIRFFERLAGVIDEFANGILLGKGPTNNLFAAMNSLFGPKLGEVAIGGLIALRSEMAEVRAELSDFFSTVDTGSLSFQTFGLAIQGFLETMATGSARAVTVEAMDAIGRIFGQSNFSATLMSAARAVGDFVGQVIGYGTMLVQVWTGLMGDIGSNIIRIFSGTGLSGIFEGIGNLIKGIVGGMASAFTAILGTVEKVTDKVADFAEKLREAGDAGIQFMGFAVTFEGVMRGIGAAIGAVFGARLVLMLSPVSMMFARMIPLATNFAAVIVGLGGRLLLVAANVAIMTAAWIAQLAVMGAVLLAKALLTAANIALAASNAANTVATAGSTAATGALGGVLTFLTGVSAAASGALTMLSMAVVGYIMGASLAAVITTAIVAALTLVAIVAFAAAAAFALIAGALLAVAAVALTVVFATQGIGAGFSALLSLIQGIWTGLQLVIAVVTTLVSIFMSLVGVIGDVLGVGNNFYTLGVMIGGAISIAVLAVLTLIAALAGLAVALAVSFAPVLVPIALVGAAVLGLIIVFRKLGDYLNELFPGLKLQVLEFAQNFEAAMDNAVDAVIGKLAELGNAIKDWLPDEIDPFGEFKAPNYSQDAERRLVAINNLQAGITAEQYKAQQMVLGSGVWTPENEFIYDYMVKFRVDVDTSEVDEASSGLMSVLETLGLDDEVKELALKYNIDVDNLGVSDLQTLVGEMMKVPEIQSELSQSDIDWSILGPSGKEFMEAQSAWNQYQEMVDNVGKVKADAFYRANDVPIPTEPSLSDWMADEAAAAEEAAYTFEEASQDWLAAVQAISQLSVADRLSALFDPLAGKGGKSLIGFVAGIGDTIIQAAQAGGGGQWLNMDELLADVAGSGVALDENLAGRNIHEALRPAMQIISDQTGIAIEDLLADVPKFYAPEEFLAPATVDMVQGIADFTTKYGTELFRQLDTLGTDWLNEAGVPMEEFGLEWSELNQYAIGKALAGQDWNLADYLSESWGVSVQEAEDYLISHGIDPDAVSSEWYDGVEEAILSNAGAFNALTTEQYEWLEDATNGFTTNVISMTRDAWMGMSDTQKQILTQMGYNFVIDDIIPQEALNNARSQIQEFADVLGGQGVEFPTDIPGMKDWAASWTEVDRFVDDAGTSMVRLQDSLGNTIEVPAVLYDNFINSLDLVGHHAEEAKRRYDEIRKKFENEPIKMAGGLGGVTTGILATGLGTGEQAVSEFLGFSLPDAEAFAGQVTTVVSQAFSQGVSEADISGELTTALEGLELKVKVGADLEVFNSAIMSIDMALNALNLVDYKIKVGIDLAQFNAGIFAIDTALNALNSLDYKIQVGVDLAEFNSGILAIDMALNALNLVNYKIKIGADTTAFNAAITGMNLGASMIPPVKVKVIPDMSSFWTSLTALASGNAGGGPSMGGASSVKVPVIGNITSFEMNNTGDITVDVIAIITTFIKESNGDVTVDVKAIVTGFDFPGEPGAAAAAVPVKAVVETIDMPDTVPPITIPIAETGGAAVGQLISGLIALAGQLAVTWTATIAQAGGAGVGSLISGLIQLGGVYATTYTATLAQSGGAGVGSLISGLIKLLGVYEDTYTATLSINDGASSTLRSVLSMLQSVDGYTATATITTNQVTTTRTVNLGTSGVTAARGGRIGSAGMESRRTTDIWNYPGLVARATGGMVNPWEYTLVGERGPEIVKLPEGAFVHTATQTANMLRQSAQNSLSQTAMTNPLAAGVGGGTMVINNNNTREGDSYTFGDVIIQAPDADSGRASVDRFFEQLDRRAGHKQELAKRGMVPTNDPTFW